MREIGSEFWSTEYKKSSNYSSNGKYFLSGRTAIDCIINDIKESQKIHSVMMPSYCCESMIEPFASNGIKVDFYNVNKNRIDYFANDDEAILLIDYFGYKNSYTEEIYKKAKTEGKIIIYDATHKINEIDFPADYVFCSYRKWTFCNFAVAIKNYGQFNYHCENKMNREYVELREKAAKLKAAYINGEIGTKENFLYLYNRAEEILTKDYAGYCGKKEEIDKDAIIQRRQQNAKQLMDGIKHIPQVDVWFDNVSDSDTPLFVPILLENKTRNKLREYLIKNRIYCPIHWPISTFILDNYELYETELSLICDQRYVEKDIDREIDAIKQFFKENQI